MTNNSTDPIRFSVPTRPSSDRSRKLGKGLGALMGDARREEPLVNKDNSTGAEANDPDDTSSLRMVPISAITPLPGNPRKHFDAAGLDELAASIAKRGVIQPIIVRRQGKDRFDLVAGERRWRAAQKAQLHEIPALVRDLDEREVLAIALIENLQREDLNPVEEARAYLRLSEEQDMTQAEIAAMVEKSRSHVANTQRLLALPDHVLDLVKNGSLSMGHARALIGHDDASELATRTVKQGLSVRAVEKLVRQPEKHEPSAKSSVSSELSAQDADIAAVQQHLEDFLGLKVRIKPDGNSRSGAITIRYGTLDQLDLVCQRLTGGAI